MATNQFWQGFDKRAGVAGASGALSGLAAIGGIYKLIHKGMTDPAAKGISKHLGNLVRKASAKHPVFGPLAAGGLPLLGGSAVGIAVGKGVSALAKRHAGRIAKLKGHITAITDKIRKHYRKLVSGKK